MATGTQQPVITPKLSDAGEGKPAPAKDMNDPATYAAEVRARRGDIRNLESRLSYMGEIRAGWSRRWCNDDGDNIAQRIADGWRFVTRDQVTMSPDNNLAVNTNEDLGDRVTKTTGMGPGVPPIKVYLMEIPTEMAEELLDVRSRSKVRLVEDSIRAATIGVSSGKTYNPGETPGSMFAGTHNTISRPA